MAILSSLSSLVSPPPSSSPPSSSSSSSSLSSSSCNFSRFFANSVISTSLSFHTSSESILLHTNPQKRSTNSRCKHLGLVRCCSSSEGGIADVARQLGGLLWGRGLPPSLLVGVVREVWTSGWMIMMKQLAPSGSDGAFRRPDSQFRNRPAVPESGRYHLYVSLTCPWAHRAMIVHVLKGLADAVPLSVAVAGKSGLWEFCPESESSLGILSPTLDKANGCQRLADVYRLRKGGYAGRSTVPMLWDSHEKEVVNNESADIIEILNSDFNEFAQSPDLDLAPKHLKQAMETWNERIYSNVNNGVYRCGFAQSQDAYEVAVRSLFSTLDDLEEHLDKSRYLCGDDLTLADIRLFTTLYRFDSTYNILFKCSRKKLFEYQNLYGYLRDIYQIPGVASTCDLQAIMDGYYKVLFPLNPGGIRPLTPGCCESSSLLLSHDREKLLRNAVEAVS